MSFGAPLGLSEQTANDGRRRTWTDDRYATEEPLGRTLRAHHRRVDDRPRRHDRERGAARHPGRPRLLAVRARLGREPLPDRVRRPAAAGRTAWRPDLAPGRLPGRA